jgi:hypothetical protein
MDDYNFGCKNNTGAQPPFFTGKFSRISEIILFIFENQMILEVCDGLK